MNRIFRQVGVVFEELPVISDPMRDQQIELLEAQPLYLGFIILCLNVLTQNIKLTAA